MATQLQLRRGNTAQTAVFTGALAEVTVDTDKKTVIVHDGVTAGGYALALEQGSSAQAQAAYDRANSAFGQANLSFDAANSAVTTGQANVGAGLISVTNAYQANVGAARIADVASGQANVGAGLISVTSAYEANIGAARIADTSSAQANAGAALIDAKSYTDTSNTNLKNYTDSTFLKLSSSSQTVTGNLILNGYVTVQNDLTISGNVTTINTIELNVADNEVVLNSDWDSSQIPTQNAGITINRGLYTNAFIRYDESNGYWVLRDNVDQYIIATTSNVGSAIAQGQANVGAGLIAVTSSYEANVGEAKIISLGRADSAFGQANLAFDKANSANNLAQNAYDAANTATTSGGARAFDQANLAFDKANSAFIHANNAFAAANNEILTRQANVGEAVITITGAYEANVGAARIADQATSQANVGAAIISVTSSYEANVGAAKIISLARADSAFAQANLAFDAANNVAPQIQPTRDVANSAFAQANLAFNKANSGFDLATSSFAQANLAYDGANSAFIHANNAFAAANSKISSSGGTIFGDLSVTGNLTITGNTTTINVSSLAITDTIIQLGIENLNDTLDIGFIGHYANTPNNHTGLVRSAFDGKYYLFDNYQIDEPGNAINFANTGVATLSANLVTNVITLRGVDPLDYANTIQTASQANVGAGLITVTNAYEANVGAGLITKVAKAGDTMTGTLSTSGTLIGSSLTSNNIVTVNTHSVYEATAVTTGSTAQFTLDSFSTTDFRSAKYLVQITSGSSYELLEMTLIHDGTTVYLSQYGNIKTGATLGVFDATISSGTLSVLATPTNAITTFKSAATLIPI